MKVRLGSLLLDDFAGEWGQEGTPETGVPVLRTLNFNNDGTIDWSDLAYRSLSQAKVEVKRLLPGDTIIEKSGGGPKQPVGRVVYYNGPADRIILCNNFTSVLRPDTKKVDPLFLNMMLRYNHSIGHTLRYQNKTIGIINLRLRNYLNSQVELPKSIDDQRRIAALLSRAEGLIAKRKESILLLDELVRSVFLEMFGDPATNPNGFKPRLLSDFYSSSYEGTKCGPFGSALKKNEYREEGIPVWVMDNIKSGGQFDEAGCYFIDDSTFDRLRGYAVEDGDIIISRAGTVGKMAVVRSKHKWSLISTNLLRLRLNDKLRPEYFVALMTICKGRVGRLKIGPDGSFTHMGTGVLDKLKFPYPSVELQDEFLRFVAGVDKLRRPLNESSEALEELYGSLSQRAFRGELDISRVGPSGSHSAETPSFPSPGGNASSPRTPHRRVSYDREKVKHGKAPPSDKASADLNFDTLIYLLDFDDRRNQPFRFEELLKEAERRMVQASGKQLKDLVYRALDADPPMLKQVFVNKEVRTPNGFETVGQMHLQYVGQIQ